VASARRLVGGTAPKPPFGSASLRLNPRRRVIAAVVAVLALLLLLDQLGVRRLSGEDFPIRDPLGRELRAHVERLASPEWGGRKPGSLGHAEAARYLDDALGRAGIAPLPSAGNHLVPLVDGSGRTRADLENNVIGWLPATDPGLTMPAIVLGAHFDHIGPTKEGTLLGADDNASGVAVLLGAVPLLRDRVRRHPIVVVFFDTEELPWFGTPLMGSQAFMRALPPELGERPALAVVLDLVGGVVWRHAADVLFACGAEKTFGLGAIVDGVHEGGLEVRRLGIHMVENIPGARRSPVSDYDVFRNSGLPFLFLSSGRTPRYHRPTDLPSTLYYDRMARTSRWIARLVGAVDQADDGRFERGAEDLATDLETSLWFLDAAALPWRSVPGTGPITAVKLLGDRSRLRGMRGRRDFTSDDVLALERASFRVQCLIYAFPACFTL